MPQISNLPVTLVSHERDPDVRVYTAKASNKAGKHFTSTTIYCTTKANISLNVPNILKYEKF